MHIDFDPLQVEWTNLAPPLNQFGGGAYDIFKGIPFQRGSGIGSLFRSFLRYLIPIGKEVGTAIGRQTLESGNRVLSNVLEGKDLKESLISESKAGLKNLLEKAATNIDKQKGQGFDFKRYKKATEPGIGKITRKKRAINKLSSRLGPPNFMPSTPIKSKKNPKRIRFDALGTY